jgi:hypothetical protein
MVLFASIFLQVGSLLILACWSTGATLTDVDAKLKQLDEIYVSTYFLLIFLSDIYIV